MKFELLSKAGNSLSKVTGKFGLKVRERSPEILLAAGVVGVVGTVVLACRATLKVDEVLERHKEKMDKIHEGEEVDEEYDKEDAPKDKFVVYCQTGWELTKLYSPAVTLGVFSISCLLVSNGIMKKRYASAVAAYTSVSNAFKEYRDRVRAEENGEELDRKYRFGTHKEKVVREEVDENGKVKKVKEEVEIYDGPTSASDYARVFDSENKNWDRTTNYSLLFLKAQQEMLNNLLHTRGHVFLNEVYNALGFSHTQEGALVGWRDEDMYGKENVGDGYIDFGLYNLQDVNVRRFINGEENVILLDFNVDGPIFNKINKKNALK